MKKTEYAICSDGELLQALTIGDGLAFEAIYKRHWRKVYLTACKKLHSKEVAEELTQNIFVSLWERRATLAITTLESYLMTALKYKVINYIDATLLKNKIFHNLQQTSTDIVGPNVDNLIAMKEIRAAIEIALTGLPEKTQTIFRLSRFENKTIKEIAALINMNEKAVEYHITQSLKKMRIHLKDFIITANGILVVMYL